MTQTHTDTQATFDDEEPDDTVGGSLVGRQEEVRAKVGGDGGVDADEGTRLRPPAVGLGQRLVQRRQWRRRRGASAFDRSVPHGRLVGAQICNGACVVNTAPVGQVCRYRRLTEDAVQGPESEARLSQSPQAFALDVDVGNQTPADGQEAAHTRPGTTSENPPLMS